MKRFALLALVLTSTVAGAQSYGRMDFSLVNAQGQAISGASVYVYAQAGCGTPTAGAQAQLYLTASGTPIQQPLTTDGFGHAYAYTAPGCVTVQYSSPFTGAQTYADQVVTVPGGIYLSLAGGTLSGALIDQVSIATPIFNGIPQADQFAGADFCVKLRAAEVYALANNINLVDATHFPKTVSCSVDPFNSIATALTTVKLTVLLPASDIQTTVPWVINNSGLNIKGMGPAVTWIDYTGGSTSVIFTMAGSSGTYLWNNQISGLSVIGGSSNATDGIYLTYAQHIKLEDIDTWGVSGKALHTAFVVTPTLIRHRVSGNDALAYGWTSRTTPTNGLYLDQAAPGLQTTDGTVVDEAAEGVTGYGWVLQSANQMVFTAGTSENNSKGISITSSSSYNTFTGTDLEQNTANVNGVDFNDNGFSNYLINAISTSTCTACSSIYVTNSWGYVDGGYQATTPGGGGLNWRRWGSQFMTPIVTAGITNTGGISNVGFVTTQANIASGGSIPSPGVSSQWAGLGYNGSGGSGEASYFTEYIPASSIYNVAHSFFANTNSGYVNVGQVLRTGIYNAPAGYQYNGAAPNGHCLLGNGTAYVDSSTCGTGGGVADVTVSVGSFAIPANTCYGSTGSTTPATFTMTGLTTSMKVSAGFTGNPSAVNGWGATGGLNIAVWPSASNTGSYLVCNSTSGSITGGAITFIMGAQ